MRFFLTNLASGSNYVYPLCRRKITLGTRTPGNSSTGDLGKITFMLTPKSLQKRKRKRTRRNWKLSTKCSSRYTTGVSEVLTSFSTPFHASKRHRDIYFRLQKLRGTLGGKTANPCSRIKKNIRNWIEKTGCCSSACTLGNSGMKKGRGRKKRKRMSCRGSNNC